MLTGIKYDVESLPENTKKLNRYMAESTATMFVENMTKDNYQFSSNPGNASVLLNTPIENSVSDTGKAFHRVFIAAEKMRVEGKSSKDIWDYIASNTETVYNSLSAKHGGVSKLKAPYYSDKDVFDGLNSGALSSRAYLLMSEDQSLYEEAISDSYNFEQILNAAKSTLTEEEYGRFLGNLHARASLTTDKKINKIEKKLLLPAIKKELGGGVVLNNLIGGSYGGKRVRGFDLSKVITDSVLYSDSVKGGRPPAIDVEVGSGRLTNNKFSVDLTVKADGEAVKSGTITVNTAAGLSFLETFRSGKNAVSSGG